MNLQPLFDFSPLGRMMLAGLVLAAVPLLWVALKKRRASGAQRLHALAWVTLFLTFDLVVFGAFTRLSDSGLGCPDWPGCYGNASPLGAVTDIATAQAAMPTGPVTLGKAWVEMIHRYLATGVGVLVIAILVAIWWLPASNAGKPRALAVGRQPNQPKPGLRLAIATLVWVCIQGAFGAFTVTMKLFPAIVTLHLLGGMVLLALLTWQMVRLGQAANIGSMVTIGPATQRLLWLAAAVLALQIALGGWVSTNYAVLACSDFPKCQGSWWPDMNFEQGFALWRPLGLTALGDHITFAALTAIHFAHRLTAALVLLVVGVLALRLNRVNGLRLHSRWLAGLIGLQVATGVSNVVLDWPLLAALMHTGGAGALVIAITWTASATRTAPVARQIATQQRRSARLTAPHGVAANAMAAAAAPEEFEPTNHNQADLSFGRTRPQPLPYPRTDPGLSP